MQAKDYLVRFVAAATLAFPIVIRVWLDIQLHVFGFFQMMNFVMFLPFLKDIFKLLTGQPNR